MLVFVDESGDTGFKFERNSSLYFTVTAVWFERPRDAENCDAGIDRLAGRIGRSKEYRFANTTELQRHQFFECANQYDFRFASVVMNKRKLISDGFRHKESFMKLTIRYAFTHLADAGLRDATVVVDRSGSRDFCRTLKSYLKKRIRRADGSSIIKNVRSERSHNNRLIQLSDMVCGAISKSIGGSQDDKRFRAMLSGKELIVQVWPK
jgi:hypothetical protein